MYNALLSPDGHGLAARGAVRRQQVLRLVDDNPMGMPQASAQLRELRNQCAHKRRARLRGQSRKIHHATLIRAAQQPQNLLRGGRPIRTAKRHGLGDRTVVALDINDAKRIALHSESLQQSRSQF